MAGSNKTENEKPPTIVIKRIKKIAAGHHGGAWKVAYADFVTAMMAFFLLLWLLNVTTEEQKNAISNYFDPSHPKISDVVSGSGGILGGMTMTTEGAMVSTVQPIVQPEQPDTTTRGEQQGMSTPGENTDGSAKSMTEAQLEEQLRKKEDERFKVAADKLKQDMANSPELKDLLNNVLVDITPEGLRIQIVDDKGRSMFPSGSSVMYDFMRQILLKVTSAVLPLPNQVSVRGHTDSVKYREPNKYDNWNLSADRAIASRRVINEGGMPDKRIENVMGRADREPMVPAEPANPKNRRITIILLRDHINKPARPLPGLTKQQTPAEKVIEKAGVQKQQGIQIIDDTKPGAPTVAGGSQKGQATDTENQPDTSIHGRSTGGSSTPATHEQELPPGYVPLPVSPGGVKNPNPGQKSVTFGEAPANAPDLYKGPVESPYVNKPPTIRTPVFHMDEDDGASATPPVTTAPAIHGGAPLIVTPSTQAPVATAAPKTLVMSPVEDTTGDMKLIQPKGAAAPQTMTFGDDSGAPKTAPIAPEGTEAAKSSPDKKVLTFE